MVEELKRRGGPFRLCDTVKKTNIPSLRTHEKWQVLWDGICICAVEAAVPEGQLPVAEKNPEVGGNVAGYFVQ